MQGALTSCFFTALMAIALVDVNGETCVPGEVQNIVYDNPVISWTEPTNSDQCTILSYVLIIEGVNSDDTFKFFVPAPATKRTLGELDMCEEYELHIYALTDEGLEGPSADFSFSTSISQDADIDIDTVSYKIKGQEIDLSWELGTSTVQKCVSYYDIKYSTGDETKVEVNETKTEHNFKDMIPCALYDIEVTPIVDDPPMKGQTWALTIPGPGKVLQPPTVSSVRTTSSTVRIIIETEPFKLNSCEILQINLYTPDAPTQYVNQTGPVNDSTSRPPLLTGLDHLHPSTTYTTYISLGNKYGWSDPAEVPYTTNN